MDTKVTIAQPYPVLWSRPSREDDIDIVEWIKTNVIGKHEIIVLGTGAKKVIIRSNKADVSIFKDEDCLFLFESPRDALLFKLTWGGR